MSHIEGIPCLFGHDTFKKGAPWIALTKFHFLEDHGLVQDAVEGALELWGLLGGTEEFEDRCIYGFLVMLHNLASHSHLFYYYQ